MSKKEATIKALKKKNKKLKAELARLTSKSKPAANSKAESKAASAAKSKAPAKAKSAGKKKSPAPAKPERITVVAKELNAEPTPVRVVAGGSA